MVEAKQPTILSIVLIGRPAERIGVGQETAV